ncbi:McrB family protein [Acinetobacter seifertii]|uniref:McrB family protein n=1 Tax=Acinetobacter seifertii TaxID=1530123 RepID=UPI00293FB1DD|nr:AAA family ATPase [Acinetobacter seifertii]MDV4266074.1 AAA family ATPase [Acinetobacter seifertii]
MNEQDIQNLWNRFLEVWSVDRVKDMTLEEYIQVGSKNSFTYWLEHVTKPIADIRGGDASKFGIFHRRDQQNKENVRGRIYDNEYCWFEKFGPTKEQAFQNIKTNILNIIKAIKNNKLDEVQTIQISDMFKWKIAYLYQNQQEPSIVPIFSKTWLDFLTGDNSFSYAHAYKYLLERKDENFSIQKYGNQLAQHYLKANPKKNVTEELSQHDSITSYNDKAEDDTVSLSGPLNRILFGVAGTGKTYHTINHALSIIKNSSLEEILIEERKLGRKVLKKQFDEYREQGRIEFVTFHQSFSYEDFVEGIRAENKKNEKNEYIVHYPIISGIFKRICENIKKEKERIDFGDYYVSDESIQKALNGLIEKVKKQETSFFTKTGYEFRLRLNQNGKLAARAVSGKGSTTSLSHPAIARYLKDQSDEIIANKSYEWAIAKELRQEVKREKYKSDYIQEPYILIIDEINRGNISRIFGELITLIEESKRAGSEEELSVTLPYSKYELTVPNNLYIIGTMNSSDRSLTGLDIALRRRFTFIEMPPRPELLDNLEIEGVNIQELLTVINQRIEVLLDRDHCIGHANFMSLNSQSTVDDLAQIFKQKVIPQLQEYFFDDWAKINLVLNGNGMLEPKSIEKKALFPNVDSDDLDYFEDKKIWEVVPTSFNSIENFKKIMKHG